MSNPQGPGQWPQGPPPGQPPPQQPPQGQYPQQPGYPPPGYPQQPQVVYVDRPKVWRVYECAIYALIGALATVLLLVLREEEPMIGAAVAGVWLSPSDESTVEALGYIFTIGLTVAALVAGGLLFARLAAGKWTLVGTCGIGIAYYLYAVIYMFTESLDELTPIAFGALLYWISVLIYVLLPRVKRALKQPGQPPYGQQQYPGMPPQYYG